MLPSSSGLYPFAHLPKREHIFCYFRSFSSLFFSYLFIYSVIVTVSVYVRLSEEDPIITSLSPVARTHLSFVPSSLSISSRLESQYDSILSLICIVAVLLSPGSISSTLAAFGHLPEPLPLLNIPVQFRRLSRLLYL